MQIKMKFLVPRCGSNYRLCSLLMFLSTDYNGLFASSFRHINRNSFASFDLMQPADLLFRSCILCLI